MVNITGSTILYLLISDRPIIFPMFTGPTAVPRVHDGAHHQPGNATAFKVVERSRHEGGSTGDQDSVGNVGPARSREASPSKFSLSSSFSISTSIFQF